MLHFSNFAIRRGTIYDFVAGDKRIKESENIVHARFFMRSGKNACRGTPIVKCSRVSIGDETLYRVVARGCTYIREYGDGVSAKEYENVAAGDVGMRYACLRSTDLFDEAIQSGRCLRFSYSVSFPSRLSHAKARYCS